MWSSIGGTVEITCAGTNRSKQSAERFQQWSSNCWRQRQFPMNYKGLVISVSSRCLKLLWQSCLCLDSSENKQTRERTRKGKPLSTRIIKQFFLLLCTLVLGVESTHCRFCLAPEAMVGMFAALPQPQPRAAEGSRNLGCLGWEEDTDATPVPLLTEQFVS